TRESLAGPPRRSYPAMADDASRKRVVLFGGSFNSNAGRVLLWDTWEWNGAQWSSVDVPQPTPPPRYVHVMAYDSGSARTFLFGGEDDSGRLGDTWEYNGAAWALRTSS